MSKFIKVTKFWPDKIERMKITICISQHHLNLQDYYYQLKREATILNMRNIQKEPELSQLDIARSHQEFVVKTYNKTGNDYVNIDQYSVNDKITSTIKDSFETELNNISDENYIQIDFVQQFPEKTEVFSQEDKYKDIKHEEPSTPQSQNTQELTYSADIQDDETASMASTPSIKEENTSMGDILPIDMKDELTTSPFPPFSCGTCNQSFKSEAGLDRHALKHYNEDLRNKKLPKQEEDVWRCVPCGRVFPDQTQIAVHIISMHREDEAKLDNGDPKNTSIKDRNCEEVDVQTQIEIQCQLVDRCTEEMAATSLLQCEFCECVFVDTINLFAHSKQHITDKNYECLNCNKAFTSYGQAIAHWQGECAFTKNETAFTLHKYLVCNICERKFLGWDQLYNHRYKNRHLTMKINGPGNVEVYQCDLCCHLASSYACLIDHRTKIHPRSLRASELAKKNHGQRSFLCEICGKAYTQSSHLWQHLRFHQGIKPFACIEPGCGRRFTIRPDLNDHIRKSHTGERPFHCTECDKRFLTGSVYYQHRLIHRGDRRYACNECDKRFYRADALKNHARIHSGEKPYRCPVCDRYFRQRGDRDKHLKVRHERNDDDISMHTELQTHSRILDNSMYIENIIISSNIGQSIENCMDDETIIYHE